MFSDSPVLDKLKDDVAAHILLQLLYHDDVLPDLGAEWPGVNAVAVYTKLILLHDPETSHMKLGFAHFFVKNLYSVPLPRRVDRAARYMS